MPANMCWGPLAAADARAQAVTWGAIGGAAGLRGDASLQAGSLLLEYKPIPWLTLSANPAVDHITVPSITGGSVSSTGPTDLSLDVAASHELPNTPLSLTLGAGLELTLPTGNSSNGLGSGQTGVAGELGAGIDAPRATSIDLEAGYDWTERFRALRVGSSPSV